MPPEISLMDWRPLCLWTKADQCSSWSHCDLCFNKRCLAHSQWTSAQNSVVCVALLIVFVVTIFIPATWNEAYFSHAIPLPKLLVSWVAPFGPLRQFKWLSTSVSWPLHVVGVLSSYSHQSTCICLNYFFHILW